MPITPMATAPSAAVVVTPKLARTPSGSIAAHVSVTRAGKWAVTKASWKPQLKNPMKIMI